MKLSQAMAQSNLKEPMVGLSRLPFQIGKKKKNKKILGFYKTLSKTK